MKNNILKDKNFNSKRTHERGNLPTLAKSEQKKINRSSVRLCVTKVDNECPVNKLEADRQILRNHEPLSAFSFIVPKLSR
jgi:hypothetical protein